MKFAGSADVDFDPKSLLQLDLKASHIKQACSGRGVHEQVEVAAVLVFAVEDGAEDARVRHTRFENKLADSFPMLWQYLGRSHGAFSLKLLPV
jgi:hypothetical protein